MNPTEKSPSPKSSLMHAFRFHLPHVHLSSVFGNDWFALKAEAFARFFGTPVFLVTQTVVVLIWVGANATGFLKFDLYPFILLNLAFSLQSAYAAPLILLAQTRQADRDKVHAEADAEHREAIAIEYSNRLHLAAEQGERLLELVHQNTELTKITQELAAKIEILTNEIHRKAFPKD